MIRQSAEEAHQTRAVVDCGKDCFCPSEMFVSADLAPGIKPAMLGTAKPVPLEYAQPRLLVASTPVIHLRASLRSFVI